MSISVCIHTSHRGDNSVFVSVFQLDIILKGLQLVTQCMERRNRRLGEEGAGLFEYNLENCELTKPAMGLLLILLKEDRVYNGYAISVNQMIKV